MPSTDVSVFNDTTPDEIITPSEIAATLARSTDIYVDLAPSLGPAFVSGGAGLSASDAQRIMDNETGVATNDARILANDAAIAVNNAAVASNDADIANNSALAAANEARIAAEEAVTAAYNARITANEASLAANALAITSNDTDIANNLVQITSNTSAITANGALIASNDANIASNATEIAANDADIATNVAAIASNTADIASNNTDIAANTAAHAANTAAVAANQASISANNAISAANAAAITSNDTDIASNATLGAANAALAAANDALAKANEVRITANDALIASNVAKGASNEGRIQTLENSQDGGSILDNAKVWTDGATLIVRTATTGNLADADGRIVPNDAFVGFYNDNDDPPVVVDPLNATQAEIAQLSLVGAEEGASGTGLVGGVERVSGTVNRDFSITLGPFQFRVPVSDQNSLQHRYTGGGSTTLSRVFAHQHHAGMNGYPTGLTSSSGWQYFWTGLNMTAINQMHFVEFEHDGWLYELKFSVSPSFNQNPYMYKRTRM